MRETWYVLEDGTAVDPIEVAPDESGKLVHKGGGTVAMRGHVPSTRGVDPEEERAKAEARIAADEAAKKRTGSDKPGDHAKDLKPEDHAKRPYRTRETKAD